MRIPEETVFRFFTRKTPQTPAEEQAPEPVDGLAAGRDALARERSRAKQNQLEEAYQRQERRKEARQPPGEERRQHDRRKQKQDVLLDTRTATYPTIDVKA